MSLKGSCDKPEVVLKTGGNEKGPAAATRFGMLRHAPTEWNRDKRLQGQADSPLLDHGVAIARAWGEALKTCAWDRIVASDLGRARRTAELINRSLELPVSWDPRLREKDWGEWTGKTVAEIRRETPQLLTRLERDGWAFRPPGGEERFAVFARSRDALLDASRKWPGERILVVTHEGVIKCLIYRLLGRQFMPTEPKLLRPLHLHCLTMTADGLSLESLNAMSLNPESV